MTQASLPSYIKPAIPTAPSNDAAGEWDSGRSGITLWLFGLTAMTLVFASLMLLGLLARSGIIDSSVRAAVGAYTALIASIGLVALVYVVAMGRRAGVFKSLDAPEQGIRSSYASEGLMIATTVPPVVPLRVRQQAALARHSRTRRARAIATAAAPPQQRKHDASFAGAPNPAPRPPAVRPVPHRPRMPVTSPMSVRTAVMPGVSAPRPRVAVPPAVPAPTYARLGFPNTTPRMGPVAFQVRAASLRAPFWDRPSDPTLVDRLLGRGTYRPSLPPGPPPAAASHTLRAPQVVAPR